MKEIFVKDIEENILKNNEIVEKYLISGTPYVFQGDEGVYYNLKREIADFFALSSIKDIFMVGSAKLGFSMDPDQYFVPMHDASDIDMVIINEELFDRYWKKIFDLSIALKPRTKKADDMHKEFLEYFFRGWIRPDLFPFKYDGRNDWFNFFYSISYKKYDKRKVTGAIYKNDYFFMKYHEKNISKIRRHLYEIHSSRE